MTQVDPLLMVSYGMGILPLIQELQNAHPRVEKPWYADEDGASGTLKLIRCCLDVLMMLRPVGSYFLETTTSVLVGSTQNVPWAEAFFRGYGLQFVMGGCCLRGFIGTEV